MSQSIKWAPDMHLKSSDEDTKKREESLQMKRETSLVTLRRRWEEKANDGRFINSARILQHA